MNLSMWEHNKMFPHPKYVQTIIDYLDFVPNNTLKFERLGTRTILFRMKNQLSIEEFVQMTNIDSNVIWKIEKMKFSKLSKDEIRTIERALKM